MAYQFDFNADQKIVTVIPIGVNDFESSIEAMRRLSSDPVFKPGFRILCDFRELTYTPSSDETLLLGRIMASPNLFQSHRVAFVASAPLLQAIFRIMTIVANVWGGQVSLFQDLKEAEEWLFSMGPDTDEGESPLGKVIAP